MPAASRPAATSFLRRIRCLKGLVQSRCLASSRGVSPVVENLLGPQSIVHLRDYQEECIQSVLSHLEKGHKRLGVSLATGSGKTVIFTQLIDRVPAPRKDATQTLILAHRQELVEQAARHCSNAYPNKTIEIEMGNMHASGYADITIGSVQSVISGDRISKFDPKKFKLVLVDEAHHIVAPGYLKTLAHFNLAEAKPNSPALVGVSATLSRFDGLKLGSALDHIVYHKDYVDMIGEKWLAPVIFTTVQTKVDLSKVKKGTSGDFLPSSLSDAVNTQAVNEITVRSWLAKARERKSTIVFCVDLAHVAGLTNTFRAHGIDARFVTGDTPKVERSNILDAFKRGEFPVMVNCGVFIEGTDAPNIDCVLLARPTKSRNLLVQMIGRGMRLHPGKENCHVIDMVATLDTGIVTVPTLFGLDPSELVDSADVNELRSLKDSKVEEQDGKDNMATGEQRSPGIPVPRTVSFTDYDSIFDLIGDNSGDRHIRAMSPHAWVEVAQDRYILTSPSGAYLKLEATFDEEEGKYFYVVTETLPLPRTSQTSNSKSPFMKPHTLTRVDTFEGALHAADTYAAQRYPRMFIATSQSWRRRPASNGQLKFLNKFRGEADALTPDMITKGRANDMITKFKHGARGRFKKTELIKRRTSREKLKEEQEAALKAREQVSVGPVL